VCSDANDAQVRRRRWVRRRRFTGLDDTPRVSESRAPPLEFQAVNVKVRVGKKMVQCHVQSNETLDAVKTAVEQEVREACLYLSEY
jgi:hypothetical protein